MLQASASGARARIVEDRAARRAGLPEQQAAAQAAHHAREAASTQAAQDAARLAAARAWIDARRRSQERADICTALQRQCGGLDPANHAHRRAEAALQRAQADRVQHTQARPALLSELFRTRSSRQWNDRAEALDARLDAARQAEIEAADRVAHEQALEAQRLDGTAAWQRADQEAAQREAEAMRMGVAIAGEPVETRLAQLEQAARQSAAQAEAAGHAHAASEARVAASRRALDALDVRLEAAEEDLAQARRVLDAAPIPPERLAAWALASLDRATLHRVAPYDFPALFAAAMALHQAFVVAAWKKLSRCLGAFCDLLQGTLGAHQIAGGAMPLWDAFFLTVPVVSTTFASLPRLFAGVGSEALAWLLIDEAGQATPQQAVGAIWRSRRTVIVGDPLQLEPVVGIPKELVEPLRERCRAERQWTPPMASAQTLADRANRYGMTLGEPGSDGAIWLGSPLVVHRRCLDPMFRISNDISYDNMMVYGTEAVAGGLDAQDWTDGRGAAPSAWLDVRGEPSNGHWVEAQGECALQWVHALTGGVLKENGRFKVYVITPFRSVAETIRARLYQRYRKAADGMAGTVHTFQGKEAEHVIFLLGGNPASPGVIARFAGAKRGGVPNVVEG